MHFVPANKDNALRKIYQNWNIGETFESKILNDEFIARLHYILESIRRLLFMSMRWEQIKSQGL